MSIPITGISSMATRQMLADVSSDWTRRGGCDVQIESVGGVEASLRVLSGEMFDFVVLAADAISKLVASGHVVASTSSELASSSVAIAVRRGAAHPVVVTEEALRDAVLSARSVGYSTGPSGQALQRLFARWGIADEIRTRLVQAPPGVPVGELIRKGEVELGFQQLSELMHLNGIDVIGSMPPGLEIDTIFSGAVCSAFTRANAARAFLDFIRSTAADEAIERNGMKSVRPAGRHDSQAAGATDVSSMT